jgi:hypothetical protein
MDRSDGGVIELEKFEPMPESLMRDRRRRRSSTTPGRSSLPTATIGRSGRCTGVPFNAASDPSCADSGVGRCPSSRSERRGIRLAWATFISTVIFVFAFAGFVDLSGNASTGADAWTDLKAGTFSCTGARR